MVLFYYTIAKEKKIGKYELIEKKR